MFVNGDCCFFEAVGDLDEHVKAILLNEVGVDGVLTRVQLVDGGGVVGIGVFLLGLDVDLETSFVGTQGGDEGD